MIAFACPSCGKKLSVKDEHAGKKARCAGCEQPVAVPAPAPLHPPTLASQPPEAHTPSDLLDATHSGQGEEGDESSLVGFLAPAESEGELGRLGGFRILRVLGHGGMGVVFEA